MGKKLFRGFCEAGCGQPLYAESKRARFCGPRCSNARFRVPRRNCANCGNLIQGRAGQTYCSYQCQQRFQFQRRVAQLEDGTYQTTNHVGFLRRYLIERLGERCSSCGWAERHPKTGRVPVEVEHIDGDWKNNRPDNLTLLCPNCHSLTYTYRALNWGNGRPRRRRVPQESKQCRDGPN